MKIKFLKNQRISILLAAVMVLAGMPETYVRAEGIEQAVSMAEPIENVAEKRVMRRQKSSTMHLESLRNLV